MPNPLKVRACEFHEVEKIHLRVDYCSVWDPGIKIKGKYLSRCTKCGALFVDPVERDEEKS